MAAENPLKGIGESASTYTRGIKDGVLWSDGADRQFDPTNFFTIEQDPNRDHFALRAFADRQGTKNVTLNGVHVDHFEPMFLCDGDIIVANGSNAYSVQIEDQGHFQLLHMDSDNSAMLQDKIALIRGQRLSKTFHSIHSIWQSANLPLPYIKFEHSLPSINDSRETQEVTMSVKLKDSQTVDPIGAIVQNIQKEIQNDPRVKVNLYTVLQERGKNKVNLSKQLGKQPGKEYVHMQRDLLQFRAFLLQIPEIRQMFVIGVTVENLDEQEFKPKKMALTLQLRPPVDFEEKPNKREAIAEMLPASHSDTQITMPVKVDIDVDDTFRAGGQMGADFIAAARAHSTEQQGLTVTDSTEVVGTTQAQG